MSILFRIFPGKATIAKLFSIENDRGLLQPNGIFQKKAAGVVLFCRAAPFYTCTGKLYFQKIRLKYCYAPLFCKRNSFPETYIQPASYPVPFHRCIKLHIPLISVPDLGVDAQTGPQGYKSFRQQSPEPVLLRFICHYKLFYLHCFSPVIAAGRSFHMKKPLPVFKKDAAQSLLLHVQELGQSGPDIYQVSGIVPGTP